MGLSKHVFLVHGAIELGFGIINLLTSNEILLPGDQSPPATSLALLAGDLWSYSIICFGFASLLVSTAPDSDAGKRILGVAGLLYNLFMVGSASSRAAKGWIFVGNKPGVSWHIAAIIVHGTVALWFMTWILQSVCSNTTEDDSVKEVDNKRTPVE